MTRTLAALVLSASAVASATPTAVERAPQAAPRLRFKLQLTSPMRGDANARLDPGDYDVTFRPAPAGMPHFVAVFSRGGGPVATAPAELKEMTAGFKLSDVDMTQWIRGSFTGTYARKDGTVHVATFEMHAKIERAFFEALLAEIVVPPHTPTPTKK